MTLYDWIFPLLLRDGENEGGSGGGGPGEGDGDQGDGDNEGAGGGNDREGLLAAGGGDDDDDAGSGDGDDRGSDDDGDGATSRPENIPEKFWNAEKGEVRADAMAKAYATLEAAHTKLKADKGVEDAPESEDEYFADGFDVPEEADRVGELEPDDPGLKGWARVAKKHNLSAKVAREIAQDMLVELNDEMPEPLDVEGERSKLGDGANALVGGLKTWALGLEESGAISKGETDMLFSLGKNADGIRLVEKLRRMTGEEPIPLGDPTVGEGMSLDELDAEYIKAVQEKDYKRQKELDALRDKLVPSGAK